MKRVFALYVVLVFSTLAMIITASLKIGNERMPGRIYLSNTITATANLAAGEK